MPKTVEDRIEDEVRKRLSERLASGGVASSRISQEILFMLPSEFVRMYCELYDRCFGPIMVGVGDGGKDEGRIKRKGGAVGKGSEMKTRKMSGAQGGGKRFVQGNVPIKDEESLEKKRRLDRKLVRSVEESLRGTRRGGGEPSHVTDRHGAVGAGRFPDGQAKLSEGVGKGQIGQIGHGEASVEQQSGNSQNRQCPECGRWMGPSWIRCPFHG